MVRDGEYFCAMWNFDGPKSEKAKSRGMCIADTFAPRLTLHPPEFVEGTPPSSIVKAIAFFENESSCVILAEALN